MKESWKKRRLFLILLIAALIVLYEQYPDRVRDMTVVQGKTMGTTYMVKYYSDEGIDYKNQIDSLLQSFNSSLSNYISDSEISTFNSGTELTFESGYFLPVLKKSREVYEKTEGAFDPTVAPLVNAWGFGPKEMQFPDSTTIDSVLNFVGFDNISFDELRVSKESPSVELDFGAIAKGYGVDVVANWLKKQGHKDFFCGDWRRGLLFG
jgi:thiamine biosynthesis lipoprotein